MSKSHRTKYEPQSRQGCLCGAGISFKKCCENTYPLESHDGVALYNEGEYDKALVSARAHITWYRLCHMAHTAPFGGTGEEKIIELLAIDIEALSELLGTLIACYRKCGLEDEIPKLLHNLQGAPPAEQRFRGTVPQDTAGLAFPHPGTNEVV